METIWIGCASANFRKGRPAPYRPEAIVIHIIVGSLHSADQQFNNPVSRVSAHYGVGKDSAIHQYVDESDTAFHAGIVVEATWGGIKPNVNPNYYTIGIEHEGMPNDEWPPAQMQASAALIGDVAGRWNIPVNRTHIIGHWEIRASKTCPGNWLRDNNNFDRLIGMVQPVVTSAERVSGSVRVLANVRLRGLRPNTLSPVVRVLLAGTMVPISGFVTDGERVNGNCSWYCDLEGNYFWAGATDVPYPRLAAAARV